MRSPRALLTLLVLLGLAPIAGDASAQPPAAGSRQLDEAQLREAVRLAGASLADLEAGNYGRAEQALLELARLLPDNLLPQVNLAIVLFQLDRTEEALAAIARARAIDPESTEALYTLARILGRAGVDRPSLRARWDEAVAELARVAPRDPRPHWLRGRDHLEAGRHAEALAPLGAAIERSRDNLVLLVDRLVAAAGAGDVDAASDALDAVEDRLNGFDARATRFADDIRDAALSGDAAAVRPAALTLQNLLRPTALYQVGRAELEGREGGAVLFPQLEFVPPLPKSVQGGQDLEIRWTAVSDWPLAGDGSIVALEVARAAGPADAGAAEERSPAEPLLALDASGRLRRVAGGSGPAGLAASASGWPPLPAPSPGGDAASLHSYDLDQDELPDLIAMRGDAVVLARGRAQGEPVWETVTRASDLRFVLPADLDQEGDLDLIVGTGAGLRYFENRGGGGLVDASDALGVTALTAHDAVVVDLDGDGDLDLALAGPEGVQLLDNRRTGPLQPLPAILPGQALTSIAAGDLDGDGRFDLIVGRAGGPRILLNRPTGWTLAPMVPATPIGEPAEGTDDLAAIDVDLDGDLDVVAAVGSRLVWIRNRREQGFATETPIELTRRAARLHPVDLDGDGDLDLAVSEEGGGARLLRNDGAEKNQWLALRLRGLNESNAKNNTQGLHARVEARVGTELHTLIANGGINRIGLGARRQADVVRVVWPNGLSQTWQQLGARQTLVEEQVLKGSCPFLYTWNGETFSFVTDLMWRSTLGMVFADGTPAPHQSARDWVLIPAEALAPAGSELWLQVTDELWETIYLDRQSLLAVDHPAELELVVDETFGPPPFPDRPPLRLVGRRLAPVAATDHAGRDRLSEVSSRDRRYVGDLPRTRHQGVTSGHSLTLVFDQVPAEGLLELLLWGWVFPTDTTINTALAQDPTRDAAPPALEVLAGDGSWRRLAASIGLPLGKDKAMVIPLGGAGESAALDEARRAGRITLRIPSTMEVYWDAAALAVDPLTADAPMRVTRLEPIAGDLHFRGASRLERESRESPHRFDYAAVDPRPPFPAMAGRHTRYGDVLELLLAEDDRTVVMSPGDELTIRYPARELPPLAAGWRRDWVLYTDGWVKDADLHTAASQTVEPWPRHGMSRYPEAGDSPLPGRLDFRAYLDTYQTRRLPADGAAEASTTPRR